MSDYISLDRVREICAGSANLAADVASLLEDLRLDVEKAHSEAKNPQDLERHATTIHGRWASVWIKDRVLAEFMLARPLKAPERDLAIVRVITGSLGDYRSIAVIDCPDIDCTALDQLQSFDLEIKHRTSAEIRERLPSENPVVFMNLETTASLPADVLKNLVAAKKRLLLVVSAMSRGFPEAFEKRFLELFEIVHWPEGLIERIANERMALLVHRGKTAATALFDKGLPQILADANRPKGKDSESESSGDLGWIGSDSHGAILYDNATAPKLVALGIGGALIAIAVVAGVMIQYAGPLAAIIAFPAGMMGVGQIWYAIFEGRCRITIFENGLEFKRGGLGSDSGYWTWSQIRNVEYDIGEKDERLVVYGPDGRAFSHTSSRSSPTALDLVDVANHLRPFVSFNAPNLHVALKKNLRPREHTQAGRDEMAERLFGAVRGIRSMRQLTAFMETEQQFILFLRPFDGDGAWWVPRVGVSEAVEIEDLLCESLEQAEVGLVGLGRRAGAPGGGRLVSSDEDWRLRLKRLAVASIAIVMIPASSPGVVEEIELIGRWNLLRKLVLIMPPRSYDLRSSEFPERSLLMMDANAWKEARDAFERARVVLPDYDHYGQLLTILPGGSTRSHGRLGTGSPNTLGRQLFLAMTRGREVWPEHGTPNWFDDT